MVAGIDGTAVTVALVSGLFLLSGQIVTALFAYLANRRAKEAVYEAGRAANQTQPSNGVRLATIVEQVNEKIDGVALDVRDTRQALMRHITDSNIH